MNKEGEFTELDLHKKASIALQEFPDGTATMHIFVHDEAEHSKIASEAKRLKLSPAGYAKLLLLSNISRDEIMEIIDEYGLK